MFTTKVINQIILILVFSLSTYTNEKANAADVQAEVSISPVGDFTARFEDLSFVAYRKDNVITAEKILIPWKSIKTGMSLRDTHALKYFNADKHPHIEIIKAIAKKDSGAAKIRMNGVEKIVKGSYKVEGSNLTSNFTLKLSDFNVKDINFKGAGVQDEVKIKIKVPIKEK